ncbi:cytochrome c oxidase accessory protein CcoG [Shewanella glacialipiscicola]|uniref:Cytochrome c oxidase accessory protein CcoG n=1 Tax=Shewanella glacialipiscicola TaxID=614069 RepID=A0ABQ6J929_9GAMM|nr:cytochrome c oxidase accessory protein CcoG [Shewanella glacialipiscicola]MCL1087288.1 cytochrome c oxidase accessory protein CcoG [Shewanella glacialipiscicola]MCU7995994.1 cytochrome c oxidase accessory protein CcoG [Shewanella glacialipiscicola]MCU8027247.1 cytochrome c oxidase accessory protein CcoG [Shewanella glacialipiscicola]GIU10288.1 cytochrome c oxidase accessory protein CcoG [Shewanella glacialipiscicola]GMA83958.1 cytochrome c oxidase accessory protein CcoG [Shewanella glaciali
MNSESNNKDYSKTNRIKIHQPDASKADRFSPGNRIYVRAIDGLWSSLRRRMGWIAMLFFLLLPWIPWGNRQAVWFNLSEQKFHVFGLTIWPQDLTLLAAIFVIAAFALFFVTTYLGRVWCGYTCPQTVWTFMFIWFEEKLEGARNKRIKLDQMPWSFNKIWRKTAKHIAWILLSLMTAMTFVSYFVPSREVYIDVFTLNASGGIYFWVVFFTLATYGNAGWMREIMCIHMCPYARFQAAMFDKNTYIVGYDTKRGETRGPRSRKDDPKELGLGDCIDCDLCVQVCPTGIDIRNGLQYECINCGACIDACDNTMERMGYAKGLISYTTENKLEGIKEKVLRPKLIGYGVVLAVMILVFLYASATIAPVRMDIIRDRNQLYRENNQGLIENTFTLKILNKTEAPHEYTMSVEGLNNYKWYGPTSVTIAAGEVLTLPISIGIDPVELSRSVTNIAIQVKTHVDGQEVVVEQESRFFSP